MAPRRSRSRKPGSWIPRRSWARRTGSACTPTCIRTRRCISGSGTATYRLANLTGRLLTTFTNHHVAFDARQILLVRDRCTILVPNRGIGTTDEYFTHTYQVPSWTLEIEPSSGSHDGLPGLGSRLWRTGSQRPRWLHPAGVGDRAGSHGTRPDLRGGLLPAVRPALDCRPAPWSTMQAARSCSRPSGTSAAQPHAQMYSFQAQPSATGSRLQALAGFRQAHALARKRRSHGPARPTRLDAGL